MRITSKYNSRCTKCGGWINVGEQCEWEKGVKGVTHIATVQYQGGRLGCESNNGSNGNNGSSNQQVTVTMGVFKKDGRIYVVKPNKDKTRVYAKEVVESPARMTENGQVAEFETIYRPGAIYTLTEADRWDIADAQDFLSKFARCIVCSRHLKAAKSVANSIGPVCAKYFAHNKTYTAKPVKLAEVVDNGAAKAAPEGECTKCHEPFSNCASQYQCQNNQKAKAMGPVTADELALVAEIKRMNDESRKWMQAEPNRWAGILTEDILHWRLSGIRSVADFDAMQQAEDEKERRKRGYDDSYFASREADADKRENELVFGDA